ncbi:MAG TPA: class I SAM-dependent methyltransferase [Syntrophorhabdaceae bacterium]|nr:class I SAM-dependent methyltransferase [Syntrophorhabdaceae bacterium]
MEKRNFDKEAATWDENPVRVKLANNIASAISNEVPLTPEMNVMDFGCGTGLLTMQLRPFVRSVTGVDNSQGMLSRFDSKFVEMNNINSELVDIDGGDALVGKYDLVVSSLALHHIKDLKALFHQFYEIIIPAGRLCIADLDSDNGQFHGDNTGVFHFGFDRPTLREVFTEAGFDNVRDMTAAEVVKPDINGQVRRFSVFLMSGRRESHELKE